MCAFNFLNLFKPLSTNLTKWSNTVLPTNCLSVFDYFVELALEGLGPALSRIFLQDFYLKIQFYI